MLATLSYDSGATFAHVCDDMMAALTGAVSPDGFSASCDKANSSIVGTPGTWAVQAAAANSWSDTNLMLTTVPVARIIKQSASTSFGTQEKFLKFGFACNATTVVFGFNIGSGSSGTSLTRNGRPTNNAHFVTGIGTRANTTDTSFNVPIRVQIFSNATATLINISQGSMLVTYPVMACFDFPKPPTYFDAVGNLCTVVGRPSNNSGLFAGVSAPAWHTNSLTVDGKQYGLSGGRADSTCSVVLSTPEIYDIRSFVFLENKFEGFKKTGTKFFLMNFGVSAMALASQESQTQVWNTANYLNYQIPYSSITDITGVYLTNLAAFGKSGDFFSTALGTMCKFGCFMVKV